MFLKNNFKGLRSVIEENTIICLILLTLMFLFSDLTNLTNNLKINLLQFFFLSNFFVEFIYFDKIRFLKSTNYSIIIFLPLLFQLYFFSSIFKNFKNKFKNIFHLIFLLSLIYFLLNLNSSNHNFLPFDKLWIIFFMKNYLTDVLVIKFNRALFLVFSLSVLDYYINVNIAYYLVLSILILFFSTKKTINFYISYKVFFFIYSLVIVLILNTNLISKKINNNDINFNLHFNLTKNLFAKDHFKRKNTNFKKINYFYNKECFQNNPECLESKKRLVFSFGDTQMRHLLNSIENLENANLVYLIIKKQCLLSSKLKHIAFMKFHLKLESPQDCFESFEKMKKILIESEKIKSDKIIVLSSWYNWYFKNRLILNQKNKIVDEKSSYKILSNELNLLLNSFEKRPDLKFLFILPPPRFLHSPRACALNNKKCLMKFSDYKYQIHELSLLYKDLKDKFDNIEILEPKIFFCKENINYCSMKGNLNQDLIHYRDNENISQLSNINFFGSSNIFD